MAENKESKEGKENKEGNEIRESKLTPEQNAEISAQLLKNWLNGGVGDGGD